jgi:thymidylate synthase ThyX
MLERWTSLVELSQRYVDCNLEFYVAQYNLVGQYFSLRNRIPPYSILPKVVRFQQVVGRIKDLLLGG